MTNCFTTGDCSFSNENYTGAVYGRLATTEGIISFNNVYYLDTVCGGRSFGLSAPGYYEGYSDESYLCYKTTSKTAAELASDEFVTTLNINSGSTVFKKGSTHPIFVWQTEDAPIPVVILGDINGDGSVTAVDVTMLLVKIENNELPANEVGDINGDGSVTAVDVTKLLTLIAIPE